MKYPMTQHFILFFLFSFLGTWLAQEDERHFKVDGRSAGEVLA